ncbi:hypothetical protein C8J56DRAFT_1164484 [Mycena floridula]|nr:hypothetical protein C8J56DRAFT_1164484 [Mycena floridula]
MDVDDEADIHCVCLTQGQSCDCEFFTEPVDLAGLYVCRECGHGPSKHKKHRKLVLPSVSALATPIASASVAVAPAVHSKSRISAIFQKHASNLEAKPTESISFDGACADAEFNMLRVAPPPRLIAPEPSGSWLYSWSSNVIISPWKTGYKLDTLYPKPKNVSTHQYPLTTYPVLVR